MPQQLFELPSKLVKFYSRDEIVKFLKSLLEGYQKEAEKYGDRLGTLMRTNPQEAAKIDPKGKSISKGWMKLGTLMVNVSDPSRATTIQSGAVNVFTGVTSMSLAGAVFSNNNGLFQRASEMARPFKEGTVVPA